MAGAGGLFAQTVISLDQAVKEAALDFAGRMSSGSRVAVTSFDSASTALSKYIIDDITKYLVNSGGFKVIDRHYLDEARKELKFSMTGEISLETEQKIGYFVGAQVVIFGSIEPFGKEYRLQTRALRVESGEILVMYTAVIKKKNIENIAGAEIKQREKEAKQGERKQWWDDKKEIAFRNYWNVMGGYFEFGDGGTSGGGFDPYVLGVCWSPFPFTVIGSEFIWGWLYKPEDANDFLVSGAFSLGFVFPFTKTIKLFGDGLLEAGYFGGVKGLIGDFVTPAFDAGLSLFFDDEWGWGFGFDIKYRGTWYGNFYTHSIGISFSMFGGKAWRVW
jgi:hypothetical protein